MATLSGLTTRLGGTAGEWTFYRRLGVTVAKQKMDRRPAGKATEAQLANRVGWANLVSFWSSMDGLLVGAFSRKGRGQTDYNAFMSHNLGVGEVYLTRDMVRRGACVVAPYCLSFGVLPSIGTAVGADGRIVSSVAVGDGFVVDDATTVGDISREVLTHNADFRHGDLLVVLAVEQVYDPSDGTPRARVSSSLLRLDACSPALLSSDGGGAAAFAAFGGRLAAAAPLFGGMAWLHLRACCDTVKVSTQRLTVTGPPDAAPGPTDPSAMPYAPYVTPEARQAAIDSYHRE